MFFIIPYRSSVMKHPLVSRHYAHSRPCPQRSGRPCREFSGPAGREKNRKRINGATVIAAIREYLSDILGAFMPGVYFSFNLFISALLFLFMAKGLKWEDINEFTRLPQSAVLEAAGPFAFFGFCLFSYIIGSAFCRKDIKEPDTASAIRTYRKTDSVERKGLAFNFENVVGSPFKLLTGLYLRVNFRVDFPYSHIKRYLETRNYTHLAEHIPWEGDDTSAKQRSKTFINILKARIHRYAPEEMPEIEKNEAHIRLMNSLWYAAKAIRNIALPLFTGIIGFYVVAGLIAGRTFLEILKDLIKTDFAFCLALFSGIQLLIAWYIRRSIRQYFHYMRVREILFLLEIADTISRSTDIDIFEGLEPDKKRGEPGSGGNEETK
jgi:hypothetical protein